MAKEKGKNKQLHPLFQAIVNSFTDYKKIEKSIKTCGHEPEDTQFCSCSKEEAE
jgi:hypothetical protein